MEKESRRNFIRQAGIVAASAAVNSTLAPDTAGAQGVGSGQIPRRPLGRTGAMVSILGMGGHHLGDARLEDEAVRMVHEAVDAGITFFDNCWEYHNGRSEEWLGKGLEGRRDRVFLMTKVCTHGRDRELAMQMLEDSLRRLKTDHLDLWQIHAITYANDPELAFRKGGVIEALDEAKKSGKVRFVGFSGHKNPEFHLKMLSYHYPFDTCQLPLNPFDANFRSFQHTVLPELSRQGIAPLGMKSLSGTADPVKWKVITAEEALRYAMSLPVATTISGMDSLAVLRQNLTVARSFQPMDKSEMAALESRCASYSGDGHLELYKMSLKYDNPQTRMPHGFPLDGKQKEVQEFFEGSGKDQVPVLYQGAGMEGKR